MAAVMSAMHARSSLRRVLGLKARCTLPHLTLPHPPHSLSLEIMRFYFTLWGCMRRATNSTPCVGLLHPAFPAGNLQYSALKPATRGDGGYAASVALLAAAALPRTPSLECLAIKAPAREAAEVNIERRQGALTRGALPARLGSSRSRQRWMRKRWWQPGG